jgi:hypothetical protein
VLTDRERKALSEAQSPVQIKDSDRAHLLEAVEPHRPRDHHRWAFPVGAVLAVVLTVPGPTSTLAEAEIAAERGRQGREPGATPSPCRWGDPRWDRGPYGHRRLHDAPDERPWAERISARRTRPPGSRTDGLEPEERGET